MDDANLLRDPLTGAYSRAALQQLLAGEVALAIRHAQPLSMLVIDLDHFKSVNDAFGHTRGDQVLKEFAACAQALIRDTDLLFRYGGDEFILLLPATDKEQAALIATRMLEIVCAYVFAGEPPITLSLSIGCAMLAEIAPTAESLFERADQRVYAAKRQGRAQVVFDDPPQRQLDFESISRLVEREAAQERLGGFLTELPSRRRGLFRIGGPRGVGKSRFLAEATKAARLRGYAVLAVQCSPGLRTRLYGALAEARDQLDGLPAYTGDASTFAHALRQHLDAKEQAGLLIAVDNLAELDRATLDLFRQLLFAPELSLIALVYTVEPESAQRLSLLEAPLQAEVALEPLSPQGVHLALRSVMHWEAPEALSAWLHRETDGLPRFLQRALIMMVERGALSESPTGWVLSPTALDLPLRGRLGRRAPANRLPTVATSFIGREGEIQDLKQHIDQERLVTLVGAGGIGKTRLAVQAVAEIHDHFADGVGFVALAPVSSSSLLVTAIALALHLSLAGHEDPEEHLLSYLHDKALLLVLDNFEHLLDGVGLLTLLLSHAPKLKLLVTSRERLNVPDEVTYELRGLPIPPPDSTGAASYGAVQLFVQSARRAAPDFVLADDDLEGVRRICEMVEGMPLCIELAAAWTPMLACHEIADEIARNLNFLATRADIPEQRRSARAVFDYFWELLSEDERRWIRMLAVFRGGFERETARQVAGVSLFFLSALVQRSFLTRTPHGRYVLHELLRQYAEEHLRQRAPEWVEARHRHTAYYLDLAEQADAALQGPQQTSWLERIETEHDNLRAALDWAQQGGPASDMLLRLSGALGRFWDMRGHWREGRAWLSKALAMASPDDQAARAKGLIVAARLAYVQGDMRAAEALYQDSLAIGRALDDARCVAEALLGLGGVASYQGHYQQARPLHMESLSLWRMIADQRGIAYALYSVGWVALNQGDYAAARTYFEECLNAQCALEDASGIAGVLNMLGEAARAQGDTEQASIWYNSSLSLYQDLGNKSNIAWLLRNLCYVRHQQGDYAAAITALRESLRLFQSLDSQQGIAACLVAFAGHAAALGQLRRVARVLGAAAALLESIGAVLDPVDRAEYDRNLALTRARLSADAFAAALAEGRALAVEQAITEVFQDDALAVGVGD